MINDPATAALAAAAENIMVTTGSDDPHAKFYAIDDDQLAYADAAARSAAIKFPVLVIETFTCGRTVSHFEDGVAIQVDFYEA
jgi:hypothetical protein